MKTHYLLTGLLLAWINSISTIGISQTTEWKISGNSVSSDSKLGTNNGYDLIIETNNTERLRVTNEGKVGIGIFSPDAELHIVGDTKVSRQLENAQLD